MATIKASKKTESAKASTRFIEAVGRRKTAVARVRLVPGKGHVVVNGNDIKTYFHSMRSRQAAVAPLVALRLLENWDVSAKVLGSGLEAQADAVSLGLARALVLNDESFKKRLRHLGYLTRDSRKVERKKYGLKKARRAPQWSKR